MTHPPSNYKEEIRERFLAEMHNHAVANAIGEEALKMYLNHIAAYFLAEIDRVVGERETELRESFTKTLLNLREGNNEEPLVENGVRLDWDSGYQAGLTTALAALSLMAPSTDKGTGELKE